MDYNFECTTIPDKVRKNTLLGELLKVVGKAEINGNEEASLILQQIRKVIRANSIDGIKLEQGTLHINPDRSNESLIAWRISIPETNVELFVFYKGKTQEHEFFVTNLSP